MTSEQPITIQTVNLKKTYVMGDTEVHALDDVSFKIRQGEMTAIIGQSGSGKSTLMNILGCLDRPTSGMYYLDNQNVAQMSDNQLATIRNKNIGFVFQNYALFPHMSIEANVAFGLKAPVL